VGPGLEWLEARIVLNGAVVGPLALDAGAAADDDEDTDCGCGCSDGTCNPDGGLDVGLDASSDGAGGLIVGVSMRLSEAAESVRVTTTPAGVVGGSPVVRTLTGPFSAGTQAGFGLTLPVVSAVGDGHVTALVESLDAAGHTVEAADATVYAVIDTHGVFVSQSSQADARIQRYDTLYASGVIDAGAREAGLATVSSGPATSSVVVTRDVSVSPAAAVSITVGGTIQWTDGAGGLHVLPGATVEIRDSDLIGSELIASVTTDTAGHYSATFSHDDGLLQGNPDIFVRVVAESLAAKIRPDSVGSSIYTMNSPVQDEVAGGSNLTINVTAGNVNDNERAFSVLHALNFIAGYAGELLGKMPSKIDTVFPVAGSYFQGNLLAIRGSAAYEWDPIHHEYGHYVASIMKIDNSPGGDHSSSDNLSQSNASKAIGIPLAWSEGWATYFAISGQNIKNAAALNIPLVGDTKYQAWGGGLVYDVESSSILKGEDNERSVTATLWDLWDSANEGDDKSTISDKTVASTLKSAAVTTLGGAWNAFAALKSSNRDKAELGGLFGLNKVAPVITAPADNVKPKASDPPLKFTWDANGGGTPNPLNDFKLVFYNETMTTVVKEINVGNHTEYTPTAAEWTDILKGGAVVRYVVQGKNTTAPATPGGTLGYYWSKPQALGAISIAFVIDDTGSMGEEIDGVRNALQAYIDTVAAALPPDATPPTIQLITFKDSVTTRITSNDLAAVRAQVASLTASGGGDCPEYSAQGLAAAARNIAPGGTILLATDASTQPGVDMGAVIAQLVGAGVTVNTILSGDCSGIDSPAGASSVSVSAASDATGGAVTDLATVTTTTTTGPRGVSYEEGPAGSPAVTEPARTPIDDPGQPAMDTVGNSVADAAPLSVAMPPTRGLIGLDPDLDDYYSVPLEKDVRYAIRTVLEDGSSFSVELLDTDGTTVLQAQSVFSSSEIVFTPTVSGTYYLRVSSEPATDPGAYTLDIAADPVADMVSSIELFSTVSAQTGGAFVVADSVNAGDAEGYEAALYNIMASTLGPAVLSANPGSVPRGETLAVTLTGRGTNWRAGTSVAFSGGGITVNSINVHSATSLTAIITLDAAADMTRRDVTVTTPLGSATESASGRGVLFISEAITDPTLLSVEPATISQGDTLDFVVRGTHTAWNATSTVTLGPGITVNSVTFVSPTLLHVNATVGNIADIGYRTATVTTGGDSQTQSRAVFINSGASVLPQILSVTPNSARQGRTIEVAITTDRTSFVDGVTTADFGDGVTVESVRVTSPTSAVVRITVASGAAIGFRTIQLTTGAETAALLSGFFIDAAAPELASVSPATGLPGQTLDLAVTGVATNFVNGITTASLGEGITVLSVTVSSSTAAVVRVQIAEGAALGARTLTMSTDGQNVSLPNAFTVQAVPSGDVVGPRVIGLERVGVHVQPTSLVLRFDEALAAVGATTAAHYRVAIVGPHGRRRLVPIRWVSLDAATNTVTIRMAQRLAFHAYHQIVVSASGLTDLAGNALDGDGDGTPGGDYTAIFRGYGNGVQPVKVPRAVKTPTRPHAAKPVAKARPTGAGLLARRMTPAAARALAAKG
jgi:hypothetical protein